jgi:hypothetical protein
MAFDERNLLKYGLFGALLVAGFWLLIIVMRSPIAVAIGIGVWSALLFVIFYRDAHKKDRS